MVAAGLLEVYATWLLGCWKCRRVLVVGSAVACRGRGCVVKICCWVFEWANLRGRVDWALLICPCLSFGLASSFSEHVMNYFSSGGGQAQGLANSGLSSGVWAAGVAGPGWGHCGCHRHFLVRVMEVLFNMLRLRLPN